MNIRFREVYGARNLDWMIAISASTFLITLTVNVPIFKGVIPIRDPSLWTDALQWKRIMLAIE